MNCMTDDRESGNEFALRKTRLYPAQCAKQGSLTKWINAMKIQAMSKNCADMIPPTGNTDEKGWKHQPPTREDELNAFLKKQRRLAELIHDWTDPNVDWDEFDVLDPTSHTIGTDMWEVIMRIYNGTGPKAIQALRNQFNAPQAEDESCLQYWQRLKKAVHGLKQIDREPSATDIIDAFKGGVSGLHVMWVAEIDTDASVNDVDRLVRLKGEFVDSQKSKPATEKKVAFLSQTETTLAELRNEIKELASAFAAQEKSKQRERRDPRTCFNCGKKGHIAADCRSPKQTRRPNNFKRHDRNQRAPYDDEDTSAFPAFACPAVAPSSGTMYDVLLDLDDSGIDRTTKRPTDQPIEPLDALPATNDVTMPAPPTPAPGIRDLPAGFPLCPWTDEGVRLLEPPLSDAPRGWIWDWIRAEFVNSREFPQITHWQWDPAHRKRYRSVHPAGIDTPTLSDPTRDAAPHPDPLHTDDQPPKSDSTAHDKPLKTDSADNNADITDLGAGPSGTAEHHPGIPIDTDDSDDTDEEYTDGTNGTPTWSPATRIGSRRLARHRNRRMLSLAACVLRNSHRAHRAPESHPRSRHSVNTAMNLMYSFELAANATKTLFEPKDPTPRPVAAPASLGHDRHDHHPVKAWIVDSGANRHISAAASDFLKLHSYDGGTISGISVPIKGSGTVVIHVIDTSGTARKLIMHDVLYAPDLSDRSGHAFHRIFSVRQANETGCSVTFRPKHDLLVSGNGHDYALIRRDGLTWLPVADPDLHPTARRVDPQPARNDSDDDTTAAPAHAPSAAILHKRCCHLNEADIQKLIKMGCLGKPRIIGDTFCRSCAISKSCTADINRQTTRSSDPPTPFHTVAMDIWGPMSTPAIGGYRYAIGLTDFMTNCLLVELVQHKSDAPDTLTGFLQRIKTLGHTVSILRIDNDSVFLSEAFQNICRQERLHVQRTAPYAHHQLGRQERQWRTISEAVKAMLLDAGLDKRFWGHAFLTAVHVRNRVWSSGSQCIPMEAVTGIRPTLDHLRVFGSPAFVHIDSSLRRKLSDSAWEGIFVGYAPDSPAWLIYNPRSRTIVRSRSVTFRESAGPVGETVATDCDDHYMDKTGHSANNDDTPTAGEPAPSPAPGEQAHPTPASPVLTRAAAARRNEAARSRAYVDAVDKCLEGDFTDYNRLLRLKELHGDNAHTYLQQERENETHISDTTVAAAFVPEPASYRKAMMSPDKQEWKKAIDKEYNSQVQNKTWTLVTLPAGRRSIGCLWRFKVKRDQNGQIVKYKARLCARGDHQEAGIDYNESFSPTVRYQTLRTLLALACYYDLEIEQFDAVCAFLNADVSESIYMDQPEGFEQTSSTGGRLVCKLNRALYGLVQAPRCWNQKVTTWLEDYGFKQSQVDPGIYIMYHDDQIYILALYVDDAICVGRRLKFINKFKADFAEAFDIEDLGPVAWLLGCSIQRDRQTRTLTISQKQYIVDILETFGMTDCKPVTTPMSAKPTLDDSLDEPLDTKLYKYAQLVGKLMYLANCTRPDIAAAVSHLSRHMSKPTLRHWEQGKRVLRYLKGTIDYNITYDGTSSPYPTAWQDASYGDGPDMRSRTGFVVTMCGAAVLWGSRLQQSVALSTVEAEYMALAAAAQEICFLRQLLRSLGMKTTQATQMMEDNKGCVALASNAMTTNKTKHINIRFHFVRDLVKDGTITLTWCPTENMMADILTKFSLPAARHQKLAQMMLNYSCK